MLCFPLDKIVHNCLIAGCSLQYKHGSGIVKWIQKSLYKVSKGATTTVRDARAISQNTTNRWCLLCLPREIISSIKNNLVFICVEETVNIT